MTALVLATTLAKAAAPLVKWTALGKVLVLAVGTAVIIGGGFSLGLAALDAFTHSREAQRRHSGGRAGAGGGQAAVASPPGVRYASLVVSMLLFALCAGAVVIGLMELPTSK